MKTTKAAAPLKPALTHMEAIRAFPILRNQFKVSTDSADGIREDRIIDSEAFLAECEKHGGGALWVGKFVLSLAGFFIPSEYGEFDIYKFFCHIDSQHKRAAVRLFSAVAKRGIK